MSLIVTITCAVWFLSELIFNRMLRSKNEEADNKDKGSLLFIWVLIFIAIFLGIYISNFNFQISNFKEITYIGLAIICIGILVRIAIIVSLGKFFTVNVAIHHNHKLKIDGFYKYVRHPSYAASLLSFIGFGIALNNWGSLVVTVGLVLISFLVRIHSEEKELENYFKNEYLNYKRNTKRLIPFIY